MELEPYYIVGFVDGEGCFSVSTFKNLTCTSGYQTLFEFVVTQGKKSERAMEAIKAHFGCGAIYINRRHDNHHENLLRYCVRRQDDLKNIIIPFFRKYPLQSSKHDQFELFCSRLKV